jgi:chaperonin GroEL (HSP60 family)
VVLQAQGRAKLGVEAFAEALLGFVKILAENSGWVVAWHGSSH